MSSERTGWPLPSGGGSTPSASGPLDTVGFPVVPDHELVQRIGRGSYGEVWMGRNRLGTLRAIKLVRRSSFEDQRPFEREYKGIQRFEPVSRSHDGLVDVLQVGGTDEHFYCVMELADRECGASGEDADREGGQGAEARMSASDPVEPVVDYRPRTLRSELRRRGRVPVEECVRVGLGLADALRHLHAHGLVHRDVKPSNVIFVQGVPKLADIGLVAAMDEARSLVGTPGYVPPEGAGTPGADVFSLGKVLYELSTGKDCQAFPQLPSDLRGFPDADALVEFNEVLLKACELDPRRRYQTAAELHADLALLQSGGSVRRLHRTERRLAWLSRAGSGLALVALVAVGLFWNARRHARAMADQLYVAEMNLGYQAWEGGQLSRARELLAAQRSRLSEPRPFAWRLLARLCGESDAAVIGRGHEHRIWSVAFTPDGQRCVTASADGTVRLWGARLGERLATLSEHEGAVHAVACSPDGRWLASGARDRTVRLWEALGGTPMTVWTGHGDAVRAVVFTRDSRQVISGGEDGEILRWDVGGRCAAGRFRDGLRVSQFALSPDGTRLAGCGYSNVVRLWDVATGAKLRDLAAHPAHVLAVAFSRDGRVLATGSYDGTARFWDLESGQARQILNHGPPVRALAFSPDGTTLATVADDGLVKLWDLGAGPLTAILHGAQDIVHALAFSPDGHWLAGGGEDKTVRLWHLETHPDVVAVRRHGGLVNAVAFVPGAARFVTADSSADRVRLWSPDGRIPLRDWRVPARALWCLAVSPDGACLVTGGVDGSVRWWELETGRQVGGVQGHGEAIDAIAYSADGRWVVTGGRDGWACVWDADSRVVRHRLGHTGSLVRAVAFSPRSDWLATADDAGRVGLWDVDTGREAMRSAAHRGEVRGLAFAPDGRVLASGGADKLIRLWDLKAGRPRFTLAGHTATVGALAFAPDGRTLVSGGWDSLVKLWDLELLREVGTLRAHVGQVTAVAFSADGGMLASASADGTVRLWRAGSAERP